MSHGIDSSIDRKLYKIEKLKTYMKERNSNRAQTRDENGSTGLVRLRRPPFCGTLSLSAKIGTVRRLRAHEMRAVKAHSVTCLEF